jgi:hypothetical protein
MKTSKKMEHDLKKRRKKEKKGQPQKNGRQPKKKEDNLKNKNENEINCITRKKVGLNLITHFGFLL